MRYAEPADLPAPVRGSVELQFIDRLGTGGFATVYRARQVGLDRLVAVKVLHRGGDPAARERFVAESRVLARMPPHPAIVAVHANLSVDDTDYVVMELVTGGTLEERLAAGPLEAREVVAIGSWLAAALASAHSYGVVHGDIKAANVLLTPSGHPKLADFGAAVVADHGAPRTPSTAAPEVLRGAEPSIRSDVYSLGRLLARCLGDDVRGVDGLGRLVADMTEPEPKDRPAPMELVLERLRGIEVDQRWDPTPAVLLVAEEESVDTSPHVSPATVDPEAARPTRRRWMPLAGAAVAVLVVAAVVGAFALGRSSTDDPSREAPSGEAAATSDEGDRLLSLTGIGPYTVLSFVAEPSLGTTSGRTSPGRLDALESDLGSALGRVPVAMRTSGPQALGLPERPGRIRIQAYNSDLDAWCRGIRSGELGLVDSSEAGWRFAGDGAPPLLAVAWITRMATEAEADAIFTMHAMKAGVPDARCDGEVQEGLVDAGRIHVVSDDPRLPGLEDVDEAIFGETGRGMAITARRGTTVVSFLIVAADGGVISVPRDALARMVGAATAP